MCCVGAELKCAGWAKVLLQDKHSLCSASGNEARLSVVEARGWDDVVSACGLELGQRAL